MTEDSGASERLHDFLEAMAQGPTARPEFLIGDPHMYSEDERVRRIRLPTRLFNDLSEPTALEICAALHSRGLDAKTVPPDAMWRTLGAAAAIAGTTGGVVAVGVALAVPVALPILFGIAGGLGSVWLLARGMTVMTEKSTPARYRLRAAPAALPASDPLVARLAALLHDRTPDDLRAVVGELALLVQRLVDHRAERRMFSHEIAAVTEPIEPIVTEVESRVAHLTRIGLELDGLDEARLVRSLAALEATGAPHVAREAVLVALDRLRVLEDARAHALHGLLEGASLLRRAVHLGLSVQDPAAEHERNVQLALAALGDAD